MTTDVGETKFKLSWNILQGPTILEKTAFIDRFQKSSHNFQNEIMPPISDALR